MTSSVAVSRNREVGRKCRDRVQNEKKRNKRKYYKGIEHQAIE